MGPHARLSCQVRQYGSCLTRYGIILLACRYITALLAQMLTPSTCLYTSVPVLLIRIATENALLNLKRNCLSVRCFVLLNQLDCLGNARSFHLIGQADTDLRCSTVLFRVLSPGINCCLIFVAINAEKKFTFKQLNGEIKLGINTRVIHFSTLFYFCYINYLLQT